MRVCILQSNYLPWKGYFDLINSVDLFVFYDRVQYTKNDWRNRNQIMSKNGLHWLTIPIPAEAVKLEIQNVEIKDHGWQEKHHKSICLSYQRAPFFGQLKPLVDEILLEQQWTRLSELNQFSIRLICSYLGISTQFGDSSEFVLPAGRVERLVSLLQQVGATEYLTGPAAKAYLAGYEHLFEQAQIRLLYKSYSGYKRYIQQATPFTDKVSILDLIANVERSSFPQYLSCI